MQHPVPTLGSASLRAFGLLALAGVLASCNGSQSAAEAKTKAEAAAAPVNLRTEPVKHGLYRPTADVSGSLEPVAAVQLGFTVGGRVEKLLVSRGDLVNEGDAIATLDDAIAQGQLAQAKAGRTAAQAQADEVAATWARLEKLGDALSGQDRAKAEMGLTATRAQLEQAEAAVRMAETNVRYHTLRAPISGVVTNGPDNAGILVGPGTVLFVIEDLSALRLKASVPETVTWMSRTSTATIEGVPAVVERVVPSLDPATRRLPVELRVDAPPATLLAHGFVRAAITSDVDLDGWDVPKGALVSRPEFGVIVAGTPPRVVPVTMLSEKDGRVIVAGELKDGDVVVVDPPHGYAE